MNSVLARYPQMSLSRRNDVAGPTCIRLADNVDTSMFQHLQEIIRERNLTARFQPIIEMENGHILGY